MEMGESLIGNTSYGEDENGSFSVDALAETASFAVQVSV